MDTSVWVVLMGLVCAGRMFLLRCLFAFWESIALSGLTSVLMLILLQHLKPIHLHIQVRGPRGLLGTKSSCHLVTQLNKKRYAFRLVKSPRLFTWQTIIYSDTSAIPDAGGNPSWRTFSSSRRRFHIEGYSFTAGAFFSILMNYQEKDEFMGNWMLNPEYIFNIIIAFVAVMSWNRWECCRSLLRACLCSNWWNVSRWRPTASLWFSRYSIGFKISWVFHLNLCVLLTMLSIWLSADFQRTRVQADDKSISTSHFQKLFE